MLDIQVIFDYQGVDTRLNRLGPQAKNAVVAGLKKIALEVHREASANLSGPGSKASRKKGTAGSSAGSYPVPVVAGHLRRSLGLVLPGKTTATKGCPVPTGVEADHGISFTAGKHEVVVFDSARYADTIHAGKRSSAKYGPRPYLDDAVKQVDMAAIVEREIQRAIS